MFVLGMEVKCDFRGRVGRRDYSFFGGVREVVSREFGLLLRRIL